MKKFLVCLALPAALSAAGAHLTPAEALARVNASGSRAAEALSLVYTGGAEGHADYYVFAPADGGAGFSIVAANDCALPLLGYSDAGRFDAAEMAPAMRAWLDFYAAEIAEASALGLDGASHVDEPDRAPIAPMVTARWNQDYPYNILCPKVSGKSTMTGCVATAMAQVLRYHRWPEKGTGSFSYTTYPGRITYELDFSEITFDWDHMLDSYTSTTTSTQRNAVAELMKACGYSVAMDYGTEASGALSGMIAYGAINHLGYSKATTHLLREYYAPSVWNAIVYNELAAGRPVLYDGVTQQMEGHQFVVDGYSSDGFFHLNWGWGGMSDGYFRLSALAPDLQGIGGSIGSFSLYQGIITGLQPADENSPAESEPYFITTGAFTANVESVSGYNTVTFLPISDIYNDSYTTRITAQLGVKLTAADGTELFVPSGVAEEDWEKYPFGFEPGSSVYYPIRGIEVFGESFPKTGTYTVTPAARNLTTREVYDILVPFGKQQSLTAECSASGVKFTDNPYTGEIKVSDIVLHSELYNNREFSLTATVTVENEEYDGHIRPALISDEDRMIAYGQYETIEMMPGETRVIEYTGTFKATNIERECYLAFVDGSRNIISEKVPVTLHVTPAAAEYAVSDFHALRPISTSGSTETVSMYDVTFGGSLDVSAGYFSDPLTLVLFHNRTGAALTEWSTKPIYASAGEKIDFTVGGSYTSGVGGATYIIALYVGSKQIADTQRTIKLSSMAGIEDVEADATMPLVALLNGGHTLSVSSPAPISLLEVYSLSGRCVVRLAPGSRTAEADMTSLPAGCYLVRTVTDGGLTSTVKIVK